MIKDRKGVGGFMEAMVAMMIVLIAVTVFIGLFAYHQLPENDSVSIDTSYLEFSIVDGRISGDITEEMQETCIKYDLKGIRVDISPVGNLFDDSKRFTYGSTDSDNITSEKGTLRLYGNDGSSVLATYEVVYWH